MYVYNVYILVPIGLIIAAAAAVEMGRMHDLPSVHISYSFIGFRLL